jgi:hypothetical protein
MPPNKNCPRLLRKIVLMWDNESGRKVILRNELQYKNSKKNIFIIVLFNLIIL